MSLSDASITPQNISARNLSVMYVQVPISSGSGEGHGAEMLNDAATECGNDKTNIPRKLRCLASNQKKGRLLSEAAFFA